MEQDGIQISAVQVDGGMVANDWFCDYLADILKLKVVRPKVMETTALGAAYLAGLQLGLYSSTDALSEKNPVDSTFTPSMNAHMRANLLKRWRAAVKSTLYFTRATSD
jgi:glycerol kinase